MDAPVTIGGWAGFIFATLSSLVIVLGVTVRLARQHIKTAVSSSTEFTVRKGVMDGMAPVNVRLDSLQLQLNTQDGELARVRRIEEQINNGLADRQERIESKVDRIETDVTTILTHLAWNGDERRNT